MSSLYQEIQTVSDHPDKCINYPIGDKLLSALRDENHDAPNFVLSGVLIYAAAKIFGRKVDFLEQEILGVAKNFEQIDAATGDQEEKEKDQKEAKKTRTKKYAIKDSVNLNKTVFEEIEIKVLGKSDINKLLAVPSRLSRLQKMKEFFAKNKARSGKLAIPKSMLLLNDTSVVSNFGNTLIHDYDDHKDIVGSRKDFTSFSYYINGVTGELENDINFLSKQKNVRENFYTPEMPHQIEKDMDETIINDLISSPLDEILTPPLTPPLQHSEQEKISFDELNISIDEGIDLDRLSEHSYLLSPVQPVIKLNDILRQSPTLFPELMLMNEPIDMTFSRSIVTVIDKLKVTHDFTLPDKYKSEVMEVRMKNIFMVPIKKLKHKYLFDLPHEEEFRELKRRKLEQFKPTSQAPEPTNKRIFKLLDMCKMNNLQSLVNEDDEPPFLGFSENEQNESPFNLQNINSKESTTVSTTIDIQEISITQIALRKESNDSGFESECINTTNEDSSINYDENDPCRLDSSNEVSNKDQPSQINISGADSCIGSSLASGSSGDDTKNASLPSFFDEFNVKNSTTNDENELELSQQHQSVLESEERVQQMRQSAINVAKWKEYLKPILAESEKRSKIDIHEYGLSVIKKIGNINDTKSFGEIVEKGKTPAFFLTMLQLTNNKNIELNFGKRSITEPTSFDDIKLTLKSKVVHREKFDEMGHQFQQEEEIKKLITVKRKAESTKTSTPAKRSFIAQNDDSFNFNTPNQSAIGNNSTRNSLSLQLSQASSGYCSQNSTFSDSEY